MANSSQARGTNAVPFLLALAFILFGTGIFFPFFHITKFWIFENGVSVVGGIGTLFREDEYFLFIVLTLFTLVFPCAKLGLLTLIWLEREHNLARVQKLHRTVDTLGKWSMLDVFVVAILIVVMKSSGIANINVGPGVYLFTISVITTQFASIWISKHLAKRNHLQEPTTTEPTTQ